MEQDRLPRGFPLVMLAIARPALLVLVVVLGLVLLVGPLLRPPRVAEPPGGQSGAPREAYDPVAAGEPTPPGFRQLLARDAILPIYEPVHVDADEADWDDETLVIGVAIGDEARAYPVQALNYREMVNDRVGGTPILVSW